MDQLNLFVCENFYLEFEKSLEKMDMEDVHIKPFPCMCAHKKHQAATKKLLQKSIDAGDEGRVVCSKFCEAIKFVDGEGSFEVHATNYCFNHLANEGFMEYILSKGGYVIGSGWLSNWQKRLKDAGFDRETAKRFYQESCKELVYFDVGLDPQSDNNLKALSEYLSIPYAVIPFELDSIEYMIKSYVFEWRFRKMKRKYEEPIYEAQAQCAEYAAIFDLMGKIAVHSSQRDTIEKVKEIFLYIFAANTFNYWHNDLDDHHVPEDIKLLLCDERQEFLLLKEENRVCIKVRWEDKLFGVIDASAFLFPKYIEKYLNFAIEIVKVTGLILSNNQRYEKLLYSEKELQYLSYHDALTGLYNRTYVNSIIKEHFQKEVCVFMFDIDKLKYVNDHFGHLEGDKMILNTANILKKCFRDQDILARIGGDEFLAIVFESNEEHVGLIDQRIRNDISVYNENPPEEHLKLSISIGYTVQKEHDESIESLMKKADERMYIEKMGKRDS